MFLAEVTQLDATPGDRMAFVLERPASADLVTAATLRDQIRRLDEFYDRAPSTALLGAAGHLAAQAVYLRERASNARVRKALNEVEAEAAALMSQLVWDASQRRDHVTTARYLDQAIGAARQARDPLTEAYAILRKSYIALYGERDPVKGFTLAAQAAEVAATPSPALTGLALIHVAEGHAMTGDRARCERMLGAAENQFQAIGADDVGAPYFTLNEYYRVAGSCYLALGLPHRAEPLLATCAEALAAKPKSQAITLANLALTLIRQHKLDEAVAAIHQAIEAVEQTRGGGGLNLIFAAGRELHPWQHEDWAHDLRDRLLALMTVT